MAILEQLCYREVMIRVLDSHIAQKIAAGEVIERPASVVRELIDNAIDSGARHIRLAISEGGSRSISVCDDGMGMSDEDLRLCWKSHATSKLQSFEDLYELKTLGFRGEALYAIAAAARLTITSKQADGEGHILRVASGELLEIAPHAHATGTTVLVEDLFYSMPARREFLKRKATEARYCRDALREKALSHPHIAFEYWEDGTLIEHYEETDLCKRVIDVYKLSPPGAFKEAQLEKHGYSIRAILGDPSAVAKNRKHIKIYIGGRPIVDLGLQTAVIQGYDSYIPGGLYPEAFVFIENDPALVDVNIHPAKREVRLKNASELHRGIYYLIKNYLSELGSKEIIDRIATIELAQAQDEVQEALISPYQADDLSRTMPSSSNAGNMEAVAVSTGQHYTNAAYMGQLFGCFLITEQDEACYFIDQHAVHERMRYDQFKEHIETQSYLIPPSFFVEAEEEAYLKENQAMLKSIGIEVQEKQRGLWTLLAAPGYAHNEEKLLIDQILKKQLGKDELQRSMLARLACRGAIKAGDVIDSLWAHKLIEAAFELPEPFCPHGRPIWIKMTMEDFYKKFRRMI